MPATTRIATSSSDAITQRTTHAHASIFSLFAS